MKRVFVRCFILVFAAILLSAFSASADSVVLDDEKQAVIVTCDHLVAGNPYSFIATGQADLSDGLSNEQVYYLNQLTADKNGKLEVLILDPGMRGMVFYVGGTLKGEQSPHRIGVYGKVIPEMKNSITLPAMLIQIEEEAFAGGRFQAVYLGNSVQSIGSGAFKDCKELIFVRIPASVTEIADDAFQGCGNLTINCVKDSVAYQFAVEHGFAVEEMDGQ